MKLQILLEARRSIEKQWAVAKIEPENGFEAQLESLKAQLTLQVIDYLKDDMAYLINALYRLDIREKDFHAAMEGDSLQEIGASLAEVIIQRELEKAASRQKYRNRQ